MKSLFCLTIASLFLNVVATNMLQAADGPLAGMRLLPGYEHQPLQGIDSIVGKIEKQDGLKIQYEIGGIVAPGAPRFGGSFSDRPKRTPQDQVRWYREQVVNRQSVHLAHRKDGVLLISYPKKGINFSVKIESADEMAEALLMILTYPDVAANEAP